MDPINKCENFSGRQRTKSITSNILTGFSLKRPRKITEEVGGICLSSLPVNGLLMAPKEMTGNGVLTR